jgi:hypothetical protein
MAIVPQLSFAYRTLRENIGEVLLVLDAGHRFPRNTYETISWGYLTLPEPRLFQPSTNKFIDTDHNPCTEDAPDSQKPI